MKARGHEEASAVRQVGCNDSVHDGCCYSFPTPFAGASEQKHEGCVSYILCFLEDSNTVRPLSVR